MRKYSCQVGKSVETLLGKLGRILDADFSGIRIGEVNGTGLPPGQAWASSNRVLFSPRAFNSDHDSWIKILGHELAHLLQQRRMQSRERSFLLIDPALESEANHMAERAAAAIRREGDAKPVALWRAHIEAWADLPHLSGPLQPLINVDEIEWETGMAPMPSWGLTAGQTALYKFMLEAKDRTFFFPDRPRLLTFIKERENIFKNTDLLQGQLMKPFFEEIKSVTLNAVQKPNTTWCVPLEVKTKSGAITVNVYSSVKRHLITTFLKSQFTPVDKKLENVVVRNPDRFEAKLRTYAAHQAMKIKENRMLFGYNPLAADSGYKDAEIEFGTDTTYMPSSGWAFPNPVHCFPKGGTETRSLNQEQYHALVTFLLWFFRTEEHLCVGEQFDKVSRMEGQHKEILEDEIKRRTVAAKKSLQALKDSYRVTFPIVEANAGTIAAALQTTFDGNKKLPHFKQLLPAAGQALHFVLANTGEIPAIQKQAAPAADKAAGIKAASIQGQTPDVRFKTHKVEVKAVLSNLPVNLIAWAIDGHTTVSADNVILAISSSNQAKQHVKAQIAHAEKQLGEDLKDTQRALAVVSKLAKMAYDLALIQLA